MPWVSRFYGDRPVLTGDRQVPQQPATKSARGPILLDRWFRPTLAPDAALYNEMAQQTNQWMLFRSKELGQVGGLLGQSSGLAVSSGGAGSRARWRFAFHTSPYHKSALCRAVMYPQTAGLNGDAYATLKIYSDATETTLVSTVEFHYGASAADATRTGGWQFIKPITKETEDLSPNTTYYAVVSDVANGLIQSLSVAEIPSLTQNNDGYAPCNLTGESKIVDRYRELLVDPIPDQWKYGGASLINWSADIQSSPRTNATTTATNIIDGTSTTYGASAPAFTLNMTGKPRLSQSTGVPCKIFAYIDSTSADNGVLRLRNAANSVSINVNYTGVANSPHWESATVNVLTGTDRYFLESNQTIAAATVKVYAVSLIQYG